MRVFDPVSRGFIWKGILIFGGGQMNRNQTLMLILAMSLVFFPTSGCNRESNRGLFPQLQLSRPTLLYVLREMECFSCVERLEPFVRKMEREKLDQAVLILSSTGSDHQGFGELLGISTYHAHMDAALSATGTTAFLPMMYLLTPQKEVIFARPVTFSGHDQDFMKEEILQLRYEFGGSL